MKFAAILMLLIFLAGCATNRKKAIALSEKGFHEEAIQYWELALKDNKDDEEALVGLKVSQAAVINDRLVKIRDLRNSLNLSPALKALKDLVEIQQKWNAQTEFNSSIFQKQETLALWKFHSDQLNLLLEKGQPLAAAATMAEYKPVFSYYKASEQTLHYQNIMKTGKVHCSNLLQNSKDSPYYESFARQYCHFFGKKLKDKNSVKQDQMLISKIDAAIEFSGIPENMKDVLATRFQKQLSLSPWYSLNGAKILPIKITGSFSSEVESNKVDLAHEYEEEEPYTVYKDVKRSRTDPGSGKQIHYTERVAETKYRTVTRIFDYTGTKKSQKFHFKVSGVFKVNNVNHEFEVTKNDVEDVILHNYDLPHIGLAPAKKDVTDPLEKFKSYADLTADTFKQKSVEIWASSYCILPANRSGRAIAENVFRCRKIYMESNKDFVDSWFLKQHGVDSLVAEKTLGVF